MRFVPLLLIAVAAGVADAVCEDWCNQCGHCAPLSLPAFAPRFRFPLPSPLLLSRRVSVLAADTCVNNAADCGTCAVCVSVAAETYCAAWCNDYTCAQGLCKGCSACDYLDTGGTRCLGWHRPLVPIVKAVGREGQHTVFPIARRQRAGAWLLPPVFEGRACRGAVRSSLRTRNPLPYLPTRCNTYTCGQDDCKTCDGMNGSPNCLDQTTFCEGWWDC